MRITWSRGEQVTGYLALPSDQTGSVAVLLASGAGAGQLHPFITTVRDGLAAAGYPTLTFDYRYREAGRNAPDRLPTLLDVHRAAADRLAARYARVVLAGRSMGGRVGSHLAGDAGWPAAGLVYLGYPLVPLGKREPRPTDHLDRIPVPQLFVAGTRDRLGPPEFIRTIAGRVPDGAVDIVDEADHSLRVPRRVGLTNDEVLSGVVAVVAAWLARCSG